MRELLRTVILTTLSAQAMACSPVQQFFLKERQVNAPARPAIQVDRFAYRKAMGAVDVLFVVDNTESGEAAKSAFRKSYTDFLAQFKKPEARLLDYRIQVVTNPGGSAPGNWISPGTSPDAQLAELFVGFGEGLEPILSYTERGYLTPFQAAGKGLGHEAFSGRVYVPLFLVFLLGDDMDPASSAENETQAFTDAIQKTRGFYQTSSSFLSTIGPPSENRTPFPHCDTFFPAAKALQTLRSLPWCTQSLENLCDSGWSTSLANSTFKNLIEFKKKLVLSHVPFQPEAMLVRSANHLFRYGDDYRFDTKNNEIVFTHDPGLQEGDLLEASYYLVPNEELLSSGQTPFPPRPESSPVPRPPGE